MRLWVVSDLHVNASPWQPAKVPEHDIMVVAGDVCDRADDAVTLLFMLSRRTRRRIILTPGNHDFGGVTVEHRFDDYVAGAVTVLAHGEVVVIDGVRFVGATLWSNWHLTDTEFASQSWAARAMPEYQNVRAPGGGKLWPVHTSDQHDHHLAAIEAVLAQPFYGPTVVITHHAPSARSCRGASLDETDAAFASNLDHVILRHRPSLWVHGHIHKASDYHVGTTRVVCNPRGYQMSDFTEDTCWDERFVVEIEGWVRQILIEGR